MVAASAYITACFGGGRGCGARRGGGRGGEGGNRAKDKPGSSGSALPGPAGTGGGKAAGDRAPSSQPLQPQGHGPVRHPGCPVCGRGETALHPAASSCFLLPGTHWAPPALSHSSPFPGSPSCSLCAAARKQTQNHPCSLKQFFFPRVFHDLGAAGKRFCPVAGLNRTAESPPAPFTPIAPSLPPVPSASLVTADQH